MAFHASKKRGFVEATASLGSEANSAEAGASQSKVPLTPTLSREGRGRMELGLKGLLTRLGVISVGAREREVLDREPNLQGLRDGRFNNRIELKGKTMPKIKTARGMENRKVVSQKEWLAARKKFLAKEKRFSKLRDTLNLERRKLPWVKIEKGYFFDGPNGKMSLADLFCGKSQLLVYHFMFGPGWKEGCAHCSFWADHFDSANMHIGQRDTAFAVISRAPLAEIKPFKKRMGWQFKWVSSFASDFNFDFNVSFTPEQIKRKALPYNYGTWKMKIDELQGLSAFYRDRNGDIYHTYSTYARGIDLMNTTYNFLDMTAKGRDEKPGEAQSWVRYHDKY
jgi:predicted dithiol-disulfide oxidoreductase (DUF899 family)